MRSLFVVLVVLSVIVLTFVNSHSQPLFDDPVNYGAGDHPSSVYAADLDGDGDDDLAVASDSYVSILRNRGDSTFASAVIYRVGDYLGSVYAADLDGDGDNDLAVTNWVSGNVSILINNTVSE